MHKSSYIALFLLLFSLLSCGYQNRDVLHSIEGKENIIIVSGETEAGSGILIIDSSSGNIWEWAWLDEHLPNDFTRSVPFAWSANPNVLSFNGNSWQPEVRGGYILSKDGHIRNSPLQDLYFDHSWSPNGKFVVISSPRESSDSTHDIFIQNSEGTEFQQLTKSHTSDENPDWSPNENEIVFESQDFSDYSVTINKYNLDNETLTTLTDGFGYTNRKPKWSPDGNKIAFLHTESNQEPLSLWLMNHDGTNPKPIFDLSEFHTPKENEVRSFSWSPDGGRLVFASAHEGLCKTINTLDASGIISCQEYLYIIDADGTNLRKLTADPLTKIFDIEWIN